MQYESGGNPNNPGDNGRAIGLFQIQTGFAGRPSAEWLANPENNIAFAAQQLGGNQGNFGAWGQGTENLPPFDVATGFGKFGALGSHPFPADLQPTGGVVAGTGDPNATLVDYPTIHNPFELPPNPFTDPIGFSKWVASGGGAIPDVAGAINPATWVPEVLQGFIDELAKIPGFKAIGTILQWIVNPHNWAKMAFYIVGAGLIAGGFYFIAQGMKPVPAEASE